MILYFCRKNFTTVRPSFRKYFFIANAGKNVIRNPGGYTSVKCIDHFV